MTEINKGEIKIKEYNRGEIYLCKLDENNYRPCVINSYKQAYGKVNVYFLMTRKISTLGYYTLQGNYNGTIDNNTVNCAAPETISIAQLENYITTLTDSDMKNVNKEWAKTVGIEKCSFQ